MTEQTTTYIVQYWVEGYDYWANCSEPTEGMFELPNPYYETEEKARKFFDERRATNPEGKYRLIRQITTSTEI